MSQTKQNSFIGNSAIILIVRTCNIVSSLLVMLLMSNLMSTTEYGAYQTFWIQLSILSVICGMGIAVWAFTYSINELSYIVSNISRNKIYLYFSAIFIIAFGFSFYQVHYNEILFDSYILLLPTIIYFVCFTLNVILDSLLIIAKKLKLLVAMSVLYALFYTFIHVAYIFGKIEWNNAISLLAIVAVSKFCWMFFSIKNLLFVKQNVASNEIISLATVKKLWLNIGFNDIFQFTIKWLDKLIVTLILSKEIAAVYVNATYEIPVFSLVASSVYSASLIKLNAIKGKKYEIVDFLRNTSTLLGIFTFASLCYFYFFAEEFFTTIFSKKYLGGVAIFMVAIMKLPCKNFNLTGYLQHANRGDLINKGAILDAIISIALMYPLYLLWGLPGMALSIVVSTFAQVFYYNYHSANLLEISMLKLMPYNRWLIQLLVFGVLSYTIHLLLTKSGLSDVWIMFAGILIIGTIAVLWLYYFYKKVNLKEFKI